MRSGAGRNESGNKERAHRASEETEDGSGILNRAPKAYPGIIPPNRKRHPEPRHLISHIMPLRDAPKAYEIFNARKDNVMKVLLKP